MSGAGGGERTEKATPKRRKKARRDGQIANTPEIGAWLGLLVASFLLPHLFASLVDVGRTAIVRAGAVIEHPEPGPAMAAGVQALGSAFRLVLPMALVIALIGVASVALQGGIWFSPKLLKPQAKRLNPLAGVKRMFGPHALWSLVKALAKSAVLGVVVYLSVRRMVPTVMGSGSLPLSALVAIAARTVLNLLRYSAAAGLVMAFADYVVVRRRNNKQLKMTKQEIKEELKSSEGDPRLKGAVRSRQLAMRRHRMMADVPKADVVVVNPTHYAVALRYDGSTPAPEVVAKGVDRLALAIRRVAEEAGVTIVHEPPLARALYRDVELGHMIPEELFAAVAQVLAFVFRTARRRRQLPAG
jgi:flagellar biosynthetic protein FlhB